MCFDYDGQLIVNGLHSYYIPARFKGDISAAFNRYSAVVIDKLNAGLDSDSHLKWEWMQRYVDHEKM